MDKTNVDVKSLSTLLGADDSMIQRDDILNLVVVEKETLLRGQSSDLQKDIKVVRKAVDDKQTEIGEALVALVDASTPDLVGYQSAIAKLWPKRKLMWQVTLDNKSFIPGYTTDKERSIKPVLVGSHVLVELDQPKPKIKLKVVIPNDKDGYGRSDITATEWIKEIKFNGAIKTLVAEFKNLMEEVAEKSSDLIAIQRQIQDLPTLERAAKAGMTKQILESTEEGKTLLAQVRGSDEVQRALRITAGTK